MKYKLKDFVNKDMLIECGFEVLRGWYVSSASRKIKNENSWIYIGLNKNAHFGLGMRYIEFDNCIRDDDDITPYIQDLIELEYVEVVE